MGNVINANIRRIGYNKQWNSVWYSSKIKENAYLSRTDIFIYWFIDKWINSINGKKKTNKEFVFLKNSIKISRNKGNINIMLLLASKKIYLILKIFKFFLLRKYRIRRIRNKRSKRYQKVHIKIKKKIWVMLKKNRDTERSIKLKKEKVWKIGKKDKKLLKIFKKNKKKILSYKKNFFLKKKRLKRLSLRRKRWLKTYAFVIGSLHNEDKKFLNKNFFKNNIKDNKLANKVANVKLIKFLIKKQIIKFHKIIKIIFLIFQQYWLNPLLFQIKKHLKYCLENFLIKNKNKKINIFFIFQNPYTVGAHTLTRFLYRRLKSGDSMYKAFRQLIRLIRKHLKKKKILGIKLSISGRLHRRGRAKYFWKKIRKITSGTKTTLVDYDFSVFKSEFGLCGIKIWILLNKFKRKGTIIYYM